MSPDYLGARTRFSKAQVKRALLVVLALGLVLALPLIILAMLQSENIDNPAYYRTLPSSINDAGWIVGTEETLKEKLNGSEEGFLLREEDTPKYTKIFYPAAGARNTDAGGINTEGEIVGTWSDEFFEDHCFTYLNGSYQSFNVSLQSATSPMCNGINKNGDTVGTYSDGSGNHGWLRRGGTFYKLDVTGGSNTQAFGVNKNDDIVGWYLAGGVAEGFLLHTGSYSALHFPNSSDTKAFGINDRGDIVGSYHMSATPHGFVLREGAWKTVDVNLPGALLTLQVAGINNHGCMVGVYRGVDTNKHGFKASLHQADGDGDMPGKNGETAHMDFHEDDCIQQPEKEDFSDPGSGIDFHSTQVTGVTYNDVAHSITIVGLGTDNLLPVAFTIIAVDVVPPGMFSITLSDGYSNSGSLVTGAVTLQ